MIKNIIIIEDDEELLNLLRYSFELSGYKVKTAKNLEETKKILNEHEIDLIISDVFIDDKNILEDIKEIKNKNSKIKILITTAFDEVETELKKNRLDYFIKPYKVEKIISKIKSFTDN